MSAAAVPALKRPSMSVNQCASPTGRDWALSGQEPGRAGLSFGLIRHCSRTYTTEGVPPRSPTLDWYELHRCGACGLGKRVGLTALAGSNPASSATLTVARLGWRQAG